VSTGSLTPHGDPVAQRRPVRQVADRDGAAPAKVRENRSHHKRRQPRTASLTPLFVILVCLPLAVVVARINGMPTAHRLDEALDLSTLPSPLRAHVHQVLFVPLGALVVVLARLTLGVRALGVLSPILIAIALPVTGVIPGALFVAGALAVSTLIVRPMLRSQGVPYSARVAALLSSVAILMLLPIVLVRQISATEVTGFAYFPVVALGLVTERFADTLNKEGLLISVGRTLVSLGEAIVIAFLAVQLHGADLLMRHPELLLVQMFAVIAISVYLSPRLIERRVAPHVDRYAIAHGLRPPPLPPRRTKSLRPKTKAARTPEQEVR
jgi:7 transmembrane helices usually fused to an inactive transglutaminase